MSRHVRSHPPTLLTLTRRALEGECGPIRGTRVLAAVSGGRDSMALLHVLARLRQKLGFELFAHGVDHGLRTAASGELDRAQAFANTLEVAFTRTQVRVAPGGNLQARARDARYEALESIMQRVGATYLATAHHAEDRAETVLLRLLRGSSASGLAVLAPRAGARIRPFSRAPRSAIDAHVTRHAVPFSDDPSNDDPRFLRTRVRRELMPLLRALSPGIVAHLCALADDLARLPKDEEAGAQTLPRPVREALAALSRDPNSRARVALPGARVARYDREVGGLVVEPRANAPRTRRGS